MTSSILLFLFQTVADPISAAWAGVGAALLALVAALLLWAQKWVQAKINDVEGTAQEAKQDAGAAKQDAGKAVQKVEQVAKPVAQQAANAEEKADDALRQVDVLNGVMGSFSTSIKNYEERAAADQHTIKYLQEQNGTLRTALDGWRQQTDRRITDMQKQIEEAGRLLSEVYAYVEAVDHVLSTHPDGENIKKMLPQKPVDRRHHKRPAEKDGE